MGLELEEAFPALRADGYSETSPSTESYNCIAWAAGDDTKWWEPDEYHQHYWPLRARNYRVETFVQAFQTIGYNDCGTDAGFESGVEKVAIYANGWRVKHMARQLPDGRWTSKCGKLEDITHNTLKSFESGDCGRVVRILKRPAGRGQFLQCNVP